jgi:hypothetical protein
MKARHRWILATLACLAGMGCASVPVTQEDSSFATFELDELALEEDWESPGYLETRARELLDAISVRLAVGPGLGLRAAPTRYLQLGCLYRGPAEPFGELWRLPTWVVGNSKRHCGLWDLRSLEYGASVWYVYEEDVLPEGSGDWRGGYNDRNDATLELALHLALVGGTVSFDPLAFGRFLVGLLGFGEAGFLDD